MDFRLHHIAIHELVKTTDSSEATLLLSEALLAKDEKAEQLVQRLHQTLAKKNDILQAYLGTPEDGLFPAYYTILEEQGFEADAFLQFTKDSMQALQLTLQGVMGAKGGYIVFSYYSLNERPFINISLLRDVDGLVFSNEETTQFTLHATTYLEIDRLAMACSIHIGSSASGRTEVELIKHAKTQKDISAYFLNWLSIEETIDSKEMTSNFLEAVSALPLPIDEETGEEMDKGEFREQVAEFAMKSPSKTINIPAFEETFYSDKGQPIQEYFEENEMDVNQEFRFDRGAVREYEFHKLKGQGLYFGCKHAFLLSGKVSVQHDQIIIDDEDLAAQLMDILGNM